MYKEDTIAAIATPAGEGGVAIVRISGPDAEGIGSSLFARAQEKNGKLRSHTLYHGAIRDPDNKRVVDEVLLTIMRKPRSYTGEDVVEVHCHGGVFLVREILGLILAQGARHADPGEFTKRAFLNGRLDLTQAEGVLDLIQARTDKGLQLAVKQVNGELSKWIGELREELLNILVQVEAAIDFPEEELELIQRPEMISSVEALREKIRDITVTYNWGRLFREGARVCICGRPNVGKSSLLNALIGEQRVIVTPVPGTTRDVIEETINLAGLPVVLSDTAGIRDTDDQVEKIGVDLSRSHLEKADAALLVLDGSQRLTKDDRGLMRTLEGKKHLIVINKSDLPQEFSADLLQVCTADREILRVSAKEERGLTELQQALRKLVLGSDLEPPIVISNLRHKSALVRSEQALSRTVETLQGGHPAELIAVDLSDARAALEEIIGCVTPDHILERIFTKFCVGK